MRVLQVLPQLNHGGVEVGTVDLAKALVEKGHKAYVVSAGGALVGRLVKSGVMHYELPVHKKGLSMFLMVPRLRHIIQRERIDIVHARSRVPAWIAYFATKGTQAKFITTCHGHYSKGFFSGIMGKGERVIVISRAVGRRMIDTFGVLHEHIRLIHRGTEVKKYTFQPHRIDQAVTDRRKIVIANIGRLSPIKGHEYFIRAIHLLQHEYSQVEAWIVGGAGGSKRKQLYVERLQALVNKLGLTETVKFLGVEDNVPELLKKVDMLVLSTTHPEGFGRVLIEAGASGVPVVATKLGGVPDVIEDGLEGLLVSPADECAMKDAMAQLINAPEKTVAMSDALRVKVENNFTIERMVNKTIEVYDEMLKAKNILVIKIGALGDVILAIPSLRMLRQKYPTAYIAVLVDIAFTSPLENCPYINEIIPFNRRKKKKVLYHMWRTIRRVRRIGFDISIDFQNTVKTHALAYLGGIPARYGYRRKSLGGLLTHSVPFQTDPISPVRHQCRVLRLLGINRCDEKLELWPSAEDSAYVNALLSDAWIHGAQKIVALSLSASVRWKSKNWPVHKWVALSERLVKEKGCVIALIGDKTAQSTSDLFLSEITHACFDFTGKTTIMQLAALFEKTDCVVCGDTAPLHIASAMQVPCVALFGPTDPRRHVPGDSTVQVIQHRMACAPCYKAECEDTMRCMEDISVEEVYASIINLVEM